MKKILILMLASALLLTSCGGNNNGETGNNSNESDTTMNDTIGDENGNGIIEDGNENESDTSDDDSMNDDDDFFSEGEVTASAVTSVTSAEDAISFIDVNVYSQCYDSLPMSVVTNALPLDDMDTITHNTGLTDLTGVTDIIISESMVGSIAYSLVMVRTDGTNTDDIQTALEEQINPQKWLCVWADQIRTIRLDNDIILVMANADNGNMKPVMDAIVSAAEGVYEEVGSVVNVLG